VPLGQRPASDRWSARVITEANGVTIYDALADPACGRELLHRMRSGSEETEDEGTLRFRWAETAGAGLGGTVDVRPVGVEQSNSSIVFGEALILKAFRRIEPGVNPELELLRFLSERDFPNIASLAGWYEYEGRFIDATLGILQEYLAGARGGWELALEQVASDPDGFLDRLRELGEVTGALHTVLGSDNSRPDFAPDEPSQEALSLLTADVDEQIERIFVDLPETEAVQPIAGRGQDVRERLQALSHIGAGGRVIRTHGDYHLGQTMRSDRGWVILDFEGEPARPLPERRLKRSPLRDVAGMLRSFSYVTAGARLLRGVDAPDGWEDRARAAFLDGYFGRADPALLPPGEAPTRQLLSVFELEKAVYELRYELNNRPDWVAIPVAGILRLIDADD
jgi:maltokinase